MIEVSLRQDGFPGFYCQTNLTLGLAEPVSISECYRCIGTLIISRKKESTTNKQQGLYEVNAFHIPPIKDFTFLRESSQAIFTSIVEHAKEYDLISVDICGGDITTARNRFLYAMMTKYFIWPFKKYFPNVRTRIYPPNNVGCGHGYTSIIMDYNLAVTHERGTTAGDTLVEGEDLKNMMNKILNISS